MRIRRGAGVLTAAAGVLVVLAAGVPVGGAVPGGPGVRVVATSPDVADDEAGEEVDEAKGAAKDEESSAPTEPTDEPAVPRRRAPAEAPPPDPLDGPGTPTAPPSATATGVAPPTPPPGPPPPVVAPPGWDPAAEAAKWQEVARKLREEPPQRPDPRIVESFASDLSGKRRGPGSPTRRSVPVPADVDGCDRAYGTGSQCIPKTLPPGVPDLCAYLAERGFPPVRVSGVDPARVDLDGNRTACD